MLVMTAGRLSIVLPSLSLDKVADYRTCHTASCQRENPGPPDFLHAFQASCGKYGTIRRFRTGTQRGRCVSYVLACSR